MSQVENRQQRLGQIAKEMLSLNERDSALRERLALTRDKIRPLIDLEHVLEALAILPERNTLHASLTKELEQLDLHTADSLKADVERHQAEYNRLQTEAGSVERCIGGMEADAQNLAEVRSPAWSARSTSPSKMLKDSLLAKTPMKKFSAKSKKNMPVAWSANPWT